MRTLRGLPCRSIHGALPWRGDHDRRMVLYRFNPGHSAYTPGVAEFNCAPTQAHSLSAADGLFAWADPDWFFELDEEQRSVLQQPASRGRGDIMASEQMKGAARL